MMTGLPPATTWGRAQVAIARSTPLTLYLSIAQGANNLDGLLGIYKTMDGGTTWAATTTQPPNYLQGTFSTTLAGQGFYDQMIAVDPADANLVYGGGVNVVVSVNGGGTWAKLVDVYCSGAFPCSGTVHPDNHAAAFGLSGSPRPFYLVNDGGVFKTANGNLGTSATFSNLNGNLATLQFYAGDVASNYTVNPVVIAGAQDNGTSRTASASLGLWNGVLGGDGGYVAIDKTNANTVYAGYPQGKLRKTTNANAGSAISWTNITPIGTCTASALFVEPFVIDPNDNQHLVFGGASFCETKNGGTTWVRSNQALGFNRFGGIQSVAIAPSNAAVLYAGTDAGFVYKTSNGNTAAAATWADCDTGSLPPSKPNTSLAVDPTNANTLYATFGAFGVGHVWKTTTCAASSWTNISGNLPDVPVTSLVVYQSAPNPTLIVGTDVGVFLSTDNGTTWSALRNGLPNVGVDQVFTDVAHTTLLVATHGRGVWKMPIPADDLVAPTVTAVSPAVGSPDGGTNVTVTGTNFRAGASVYFDGVAATNVIVVNTTTMTATTPAHQPSKVNVIVVDTDNQGGTLVQGFTYSVPVPVPNPAPQPRPGGVVTGSPVAPPLSRGGPDLHQPTNPSPSPRL